MEVLYKITIDDDCDKVVSLNMLEELLDDMNDIADYERVSTINTYMVFVKGMGSAEIYTDKTIVRCAEELRARVSSLMYPNPITEPKKAIEYLRAVHEMHVERSVIEV